MFALNLYKLLLIVSIYYKKLTVSILNAWFIQECVV